LAELDEAEWREPTLGLFDPGVPLGGTLAPFFRASDKPIAIACFGLVTLRWDLPDSSLPRFILCIARPTLFDALVPYFPGVEVDPSILLRHAQEAP
jgi:hypothetical protein